MTPQAAKLVYTIASALIVLCAFTMVKNPDGQHIMIALATGLAGAVTGGAWIPRPGDAPEAKDP